MAPRLADNDRGSSRGSARADPSPVYAASYDHLGIILWGLPAFEQHMAIELERLERHTGFRVGWDHEAYTYDYLAEHAPKVLAALRAALGRFKGRLGVGSCTYGQPLSVFIDGESNIRQLTMAQDTCEQRLGYPITVYLMSEHAFHAQMPQLLSGCGFRGAILRTHLMMYGFNPECDAPVVRWVGVDGSALTAVPTYRGQLAPHHTRYKIGGPIYTLDGRILTDAFSEYCSVNLGEFRRRFGHRIRPLVATRANDPRSHESLITAHEGDADYRWVLAEDVFDVLPPARVDFRPGANEFKARMPWGYCGNWMWRRCREAEVRVLMAERLDTISQAMGGPAFATEIGSAWKNLLVAQHHDIQICGLEDDARRFLGASTAAADRVIDGALGAITPRIGAGVRTVVFNPLPWQRTAWVGNGDAGRLVSVMGLGFAAVPPEPGAVPAEPVFVWSPTVTEPSLRYRVDDGVGTPTFRHSWVSEEVGCLMTPWYEIYVAPTGGVRLLRSRSSGRDLLVPPKTSGTLAGLVGGRDCASRGSIVDARIGTGTAVLHEAGEVGGLPYRCTWTFFAHSPRIDWRAQITFDGEWVGRPRAPQTPESRHPDHEEADVAETVTAWNDHEHKLRVRFYPYVGPYATCIRDLPFHVCETSDPYVEGLYWTAVSDGEVGLALLNRGLMGSIREKDDAFSSILAFSLPYVWLNRPLRGSYAFELGILPFEGDWRAADIHRQALEYNFPILSRDESRSEHTLGDVWSPYRDVGDGRALLSALYTKEGRTLARFCEYRGGTAEAAVDWMGTPARLVATDMRGRPYGAVGGAYTLGPWQVQTFEFERNNETTAE